MRGYRLKLDVAGVGERLQFVASDDDAAWRQALRATSDMLRDQAFHGDCGANLDLVLLNAVGDVLYQVHVVAA